MTESTQRPSLEADLLTRQDVEALLRVCSRRAPTGVRNRALIVLLWRCGLRISEALDLRPKDIDLDQGTVIVQRGKGGKRRVVGIDAGALAVVARWLEVRAKLGITSSRPLICTLQGGHVDPSYARHLLPRLARRAGVERRVHPHGLRHAHAVELEREGAPLSTIRDALGHSSAAVTDRYLRRVGGSAAAEFGRGRSWAGA
jgi:site-specific recombinase XerD